ncbi:MAG: hypothetical protein ACFFCQ_08145 [Promethearchaeota archaeon]
MSVQELSYSQSDEIFNFIPRDQLPTNVLRTNIKSIIIDKDIPIASQNKLHILSGKLELKMEGGNIVISRKLKPEDLPKPKEFPVQVHFPIYNYTIIIEGRNISTAYQGNIHMIHGNFEVVMKNNTIYLTQESHKLV